MTLSFAILQLETTDLPLSALETGSAIEDVAGLLYESCGVRPAIGVCRTICRKNAPLLQSTGRVNSLPNT